MKELFVINNLEKYEPSFIPFNSSLPFVWYGLASYLATQAPDRNVSLSPPLFTSGLGICNIPTGFYYHVQLLPTAYTNSVKEVFEMSIFVHKYC